LGTTDATGTTGVPGTPGIAGLPDPAGAATGREPQNAVLGGLAQTLAGLDAPGPTRELGSTPDAGAGAASPNNASGPAQNLPAGDPSQQLAALDPTQAVNRAGAGGTVPAGHVQASVGSSEWTGEIASQVTLMSAHGIHSADLKLSPAELGPLHIRIDVQDGTASVWFQAAHPATRAALEQSLPQLRDLLSAQGMSLGDSGVNRGPPRDPTPARSSGIAPAPVEPAAAVVSAETPVRVGLVDAYA
jgi:flagellar hook-length control protein FliK